MLLMPSLMATGRRRALGKKNSDSGVYLRAEAGDAATPKAAYEVQLREGSEGRIADLHDAYASGLAHAAGEWNQLDITATGDRIAVAVNGKQAYAAVGDDRAVGVVGDERLYGHVVIIRVVDSVDAMTADWTKLPFDLLEKMSNRITNEVEGVSWVTYTISSKPPATIEPQ